MEIIPAIDLMGGRVVQLVGGNPETKKDYGDPIETGTRWKEMGANLLHVIDLDAALGLGDNIETAIEIKEKIGLTVEFGGGIRSKEDATKLLDAGMDRVVLGTLAVKDRDDDFSTVKELGGMYGSERLIVSVDSKGEHIVVKGWTQDSSLKTTELVCEVEDYCWGFLYTNVDVEGQMQGVNIERIKEVVSSTGKPVIVSGGVTTVEDLRNIRETGAWGVVLGKALYEGRIKIDRLGE